MSETIINENLMNETIRSIVSRRSVRKFRTEQLQSDELQVILEAGKFAPSAMNQQPWHFTVIQNQELLKKINQACKDLLIKINNSRFKEISKNKEVSSINLMHNAPTLIVVSGDSKAVSPQIDCTLAIQNMFIAAEALGIGSCWIQAISFLFSDLEGKAFLIKENIIPEGFVLVGSSVFGYKEQVPASQGPRRDNTDKFIF